MEDCENYKDFFYILKVLKKIVADLKIPLTTSGEENQSSRIAVLRFCEKIDEFGDLSMKNAAQMITQSIKKYAIVVK